MLAANNRTVGSSKNRLASRDSSANHETRAISTIIRKILFIRELYIIYIHQPIIKSFQWKAGIAMENPGVCHKVELWEGPSSIGIVLGKWENI
jgi:hypothetical protein